MRKFIHFAVYFALFAGISVLTYCSGGRKSSVSPPNPALITLGRYLFFDQRLSYNQSKSCSSCHDPAFAFSDGYRRSTGVLGDATLHNAPSLFNAHLMRTLNWRDSGLVSLEEQMLRPLTGTHPIEMGICQPDQSKSSGQCLLVDTVFARLMADSVYPPLFKAAFPTQQAQWSLSHITQAIAAFERTLTALNSPYDQYKAGTRTLPTNALRGEQLFFSKRLGCIKCHHGKLFSDGLYHRIALDSPYRYRTPSLRQVVITAPYFHDGRFDSLRETIAAHQGTPKLSTEEWNDLIIFLGQLTDSVALPNPEFLNPRNR
jgi:cytochrome c peroxidase